MVKRVIKVWIPFEYLLVYSRFTNTGFVDFVCHNHKKFHLIGMAKMGNKNEAMGRTTRQNFDKQTRSGEKQEIQPQASILLCYRGSGARRAQRKSIFLQER